MRRYSDEQIVREAGGDAILVKWLTRSSVSEASIYAGRKRFG